MQTLRLKNYKSNSRGKTPAERMAYMFKKFIKRIIEAKDQDEAMCDVFYGKDGIDMAYQHEKITFAEHQMLLALIEKMA